MVQVIFAGGACVASARLRLPPLLPLGFSKKDCSGKKNGPR